MSKTQRKASYIGSFLVGEKFYTNSLFCHEDDRVECADEEGNVVITFDANCNAFLGSIQNKGKSIGRWSMELCDDYNWYFTSKSGTTYKFRQDIMKAELEVAKLYLKGNLV